VTVDRIKPAPVSRAPLAAACVLACLSAISRQACLAAAPAGKTAGTVPSTQCATAPGAMRLQQTTCYDVYTNLDPELAREAALRLATTAREYDRRTRGFSGDTPKRMAFYLFSRQEDYLAAGGVPGTNGVYYRDKLLAFADPSQTDRLWRTLQHEGFHQFADQAISRKLPPWVGEGLAEYFGEGIWTGDGFVTGLVRPVRLARVKRMIADGQTMPFDQMIAMTAGQWSQRLAPGDYDQAWAMVHFLIQATDGKYTQSFAKFVKDVAGNRPWTMAFKLRFGGDVPALQDRYEHWWSSLGDDPTADRFTSARVETLTSYLARAHGCGQRFASAEEFLLAARGGRLRADQRQGLPQSLLAGALEGAEDLGKWSLQVQGDSPALSLRTAEGQLFTGTFALEGSTVRQVEVRVTSGPASEAPDR